MALIQQKKMGKVMDNMRLKQIYRIICLSVSFALVAVYAILTFQRYTALSKRMSDGQICWHCAYKTGCQACRH